MSNVNVKNGTFRGAEIGWGQLKFGGFGAALPGITEISYDEEQEVEGVYASGNEVQGIGYGNIKRTGSIKMRRWQLNALLAGLPAGDGPNGIAPFNITVVASNSQGSFTDIVSAVFTKIGRKMSQGAKMEEVEVGLFVYDIQWNA